MQLKFTIRNNLEEMELVKVLGALMNLGFTVSHDDKTNEVTLSHGADAGNIPDQINAAKGLLDSYAPGTETTQPAVAEAATDVKSEALSDDDVVEDSEKVDDTTDLEESIEGSEENESGE